MLCNPRFKINKKNYKMRYENHLIVTTHCGEFVQFTCIRVLVFSVNAGLYYRVVPSFN